ncbi:hypothetical protein FA95DRAFT_1604681 [Auriscalpium vulgare]|uniref:Uncharacterized protein n=1 Tax=Auriscalpium vulgare TaxID=40419 RepID=A0ACB8RYF6_9AGAM|nr:hypothetical protein FA95DRAFT_1604681 [Auriscalpium vulgare]
MSKLPLEVQIVIIECVYRLSQAEAVDYATLRACALVCRAWTPMAQRLLFRRVPYAGLAPDGLEPPLPLLLRTLRTSPHLAAAVRSIFLTGYSREATSDAPPDVELLELCPHIHNISVEDIRPGPAAIFPASEARLRAIQLRPVTLCPWGEPSFVGLFLLSWPNIRTLDLAGMRSYGTSDALPSISATGSLQALSLKAKDIALLQASKNDFTALRELELINPEWCVGGWIEQVHRLDILRGIHTLRIQGSFPPETFLERITRLESLAFDELPEENVVFPQSLRHVGYHPWCRPSDALKVASYAVSTLRALVDLKLLTATRLALPAHLTALEEVCHDRGVEFQTCRTPHHFPNPRWDVDWI